MDIKTMYADVKIYQLCYGMVVETCNGNKFLVIGDMCEAPFKDENGNAFTSYIETRDTINVNNNTTIDSHGFFYKELRLLSISRTNAGDSMSLLEEYNEDLSHKTNPDLNISKIYAINFTGELNINLFDENNYGYICDVVRDGKVDTVKKKSKYNKNIFSKYIKSFNKDVK